LSPQVDPGYMDVEFYTPGAYGRAIEDINSNFVDPSGNV